MHARQLNHRALSVFEFLPTRTTAAGVRRRLGLLALSTICMAVAGGCGRDLTKITRLLKLTPTKSQAEQSDAPDRSADAFSIARLRTIYRDAPQPFADLRDALYGERQFAAVEREARRLLAEPRGCVGDTALMEFYKTLHEIRDDRTTDEMAAVLDAWAESSPGSHVPLLVRGGLLTNLAWKIRGDGLANKVEPRNWSGFEDNLRKADQALTQAARLEPRDPSVPAAQITVAMGLGLDRRQMETLFRAATALSPSHRAAYVKKMQYLSPKWRGSLPEVQEFTRQCEAAAVTDPALAAAVAFGHEELRRQAKREGDKQYYKTVAAPLIATYRRAIAAHPDVTWLKAALATTAWQAENYRVAHEMFEAIGDRWASSPLCEDLQQYHRMRVRTLERVGFAATQQGRHDAAVKIFAQAVRLQPNNAYAHVQLSTIYGREFKDLAKSKLHAREALASNPNDAVRQMAQTNLSIVEQMESGGQ